MKSRQDYCAHSFHLPPSAFRLLLSPFRLRSALTLIELLVVIIILTTIVAGVIPILSPNNDTRKIRSAARGLQGLITQVQAEAARTGRPQGIGFTESSVESGVALEVFGLEVPPPFAGFSTASYARVIQEDVPNGGGFITNFYVQFVLFDARSAEDPIPLEFPSVEYADDQLPPNFIRFQDSVQIAGTDFSFIDTDFDGDGNQGDALPDDGFYFLSSGGHSLSTYQVSPTNANGQALAFRESYTIGNRNYFLTSPQPFQIIRLPQFSSEAPYQLPAGIVIDLQGSIAEGSANTTVDFPRFPTTESLYTDRTSVTRAASPPADLPPPDSVGIMFSPTGAVDSLFLNGVLVPNTSRIMLLLGRIENSIDPDSFDPDDESTFPWTQQNNEPFEDVQERINWLNLDSRLVSIVPTNGRTVVSEMAFVDFSLATDANQNGNEIDIDPDDQIEAANAFAREMSTIGGN